jgi:SAM-dependent methyltransferase
VDRSTGWGRPGHEHPPLFRQGPLEGALGRLRAVAPRARPESAPAAPGDAARLRTRAPLLPGALRHQPWYVDWLAISGAIQEKLRSGSAVRFLDYGCGRGGLTHWILNRRGSRATRYLGVDLNEAAVARDREKFPPSLAEFQVHDAAKPEPADWGVFDAVFIVNLLPYLADPLPLLTRIRPRLAGRDSIVVVVDPVPSAFWDVDYGGFRVLLRSPAALLDVMERAGYAPIELGTLHGLSILGLPALPLATCGVYRPKGE